MIETGFLDSPFSRMNKSPNGGGERLQDQVYFVLDAFDNGVEFCAECLPSGQGIKVKTYLQALLGRV